MSRSALSSALLIIAIGLLALVAGRVMFSPAEMGTVATSGATRTLGPDDDDVPAKSPRRGDVKRHGVARPLLPQGPRQVKDVTDRFREIAMGRYAPACRRAGIAWPPQRLMLLAFKKEKRLEVWGANKSGRYALLASHPVLAASGGPGPKRRLGDKQVPEGFYSMTELNPNSSYHLSIRVDYPNTEDVRNSAISLASMGGDIYIHGEAVSIGCLAIGNRAIEELFTLTSMVPRGQRRIIIAPFDFREHPRTPLPDEAPWVLAMYGRMKTALREFGE